MAYLLHFGGVCPGLILEDWMVSEDESIILKIYILR